MSQNRILYETVGRLDRVVDRLTMQFHFNNSIKVDLTHLGSLG